MTTFAWHMFCKNLLKMHMISSNDDKDFIEKEPEKIAHNDVIQESPEVTENMTPDKDEKGQEQEGSIKNSK